MLGFVHLTMLRVYRVGALHDPAERAARDGFNYPSGRNLTSAALNVLA